MKRPHKEIGIIKAVGQKEAEATFLAQYESLFS